MVAKKITVSFSIDEDLVREIEALADAQGISRSLFVQRVIREAIDHERGVLAAMNNPKVREQFLKLFTQPGMVMEMAKAMNQPLTKEQHERVERGLPAVFENLPALMGEGNQRRQPRKAGKRVRREVSDGKRKTKQ